MVSMPDEERQDFPHVGARARAFKRFERDLEGWLATAEGQLRRLVRPRRDRLRPLRAVGAQPAHDDLSLVGREADRARGGE